MWARTRNAVAGEEIVGVDAEEQLYHTNSPITQLIPVPRPIFGQPSSETSLHPTIPEPLEAPVQLQPLDIIQLSKLHNPTATAVSFPLKSSDGVA
jgi:hypothetical protein